MKVLQGRGRSTAPWSLHRHHWGCREPRQTNIAENCICLWHILPKAESVKHLEVDINSVSAWLVFLLPILLKMTARPKTSKLIYHSNRISCYVIPWRTDFFKDLVLQKMFSTFRRISTNLQWLFITSAPCFVVLWGLGLALAEAGASCICS